LLPSTRMQSVNRSRLPVEKFLKTVFSETSRVTAFSINKWWLA
jgi:hypothetical protein